MIAGKTETRGDDRPRRMGKLPILCEALSFQYQSPAYPSKYIYRHRRTVSDLHVCPDNRHHQCDQYHRLTGRACRRYDGHHLRITCNRDVFLWPVSCYHCYRYPDMSTARISSVQHQSRQGVYGRQLSTGTLMNRFFAPLPAQSS